MQVRRSVFLFHFFTVGTKFPGDITYSILLLSYAATTAYRVTINRYIIMIINAPIVHYCTRLYPSVYVYYNRLGDINIVITIITI